MAAIFFEQLVGPNEKVHDPGSILMFRDHLTFLGEAMTPERVKEGLLDVALELEKKQRAFAEKRSEEHTSELQSLAYLVCRLLLEKKKPIQNRSARHCSPPGRHRWRGRRWAEPSCRPPAGLDRIRCQRPL